MRFRGELDRFIAKEEQNIKEVLQTQQACKSQTLQKRVDSVLKDAYSLLN